MFQSFSNLENNNANKEELTTTLASIFTQKGVLEGVTF